MLNICLTAFCLFHRFVWEEQDCTESFPDSPEACNLDLLHYLEQRDMWERRRVLHIPKFCVGSIIAVTRADEYAPLGFSRYSPIPCVYNLVKVNKKTPNGSILMFHLYSLWKLFIPPCFIKWAAGIGALFVNCKLSPYCRTSFPVFSLFFLHWTCFPVFKPVFDTLASFWSLQNRIIYLDGFVPDYFLLRVSLFHLPLAACLKY